MATSATPATSRLTRRGYAISKSQLTDAQLEAVKRELTVTPFVPQDYQAMGGGPASYRVFLESENTLYVPKVFGLKRFGPPGAVKLSDGEDCSARLEFRGKMRSEQEAPCHAFLDAAHDLSGKGGGGILNIPCGGGKTVIALYLACVLKKKTLIIVHKDFLLQQWQERITQFVPSARVGLIKAKVTDIADKDIVLGSLQSISMKTYPEGTFGSFGLMIVDECHHTSAEVFSQALLKTSCVRYCLGLSATLQRKDGLTKVFKWHLGDVVYRAARRPDEAVRVWVREYYCPDPAYSAEHYIMRDKLNTARMINNICTYAPRADYVIESIRELLDQEPERRVLILSDRREHLLMLQVRIREKLGIEPGLYYGGLKQEALKASELRPIILGTFQFVAEGFDVPGLDTLVLASPKSDVVQAVGRILRETPDKRKHVPCIVDIVDAFSLFERQGQKRLAYYKKCRYSMEGDVAPQKAVDTKALFQGQGCLLRSDAS
jgi:superfamily II DNA or RNA helicase